MKKLIITLSILSLFVIPVSAQSDFEAAIDEIAVKIGSSSLSDESQQELSEMLDLISQLGQQSSTSFDVIGKLLDALICHFHYSLLFEGVPRSEADQAADELNGPAIQAELDKFLDQFFPFPPVNPVPPPAPPPQKCKVRILVYLGTTLGDPVGPFFIRPRKELYLEAEGMPPGGTFAWSLNPADPGRAGLATSTRNGVVQPRAGFLATQTGTYEVKVKYTDPNAQMCEATLKVVVRHSGAVPE